MLKPRLVVSLLLKDNGLVKTTNFKESKYIGDPINAVKIFNEKNVDEVVILDIDATRFNKEPDFALIEKLAMECRMPFCYGGGIRNISQIQKIISLGVEKIAISSASISNIKLIKEASDLIGNQSVVVVIDYIKNALFGNRIVVTHNANKRHNKNPLELAEECSALGAGEIIFNSVDNDGKMQGYDLVFAKKVSEKLDIPLTFLGGAGNLEHIKDLWNIDSTIAAAAGSFFVFKGKFRAVLISYPDNEKRNNLYESILKN